MAARVLLLLVSAAAATAVWQEDVEVVDVRGIYDHPSRRLAQGRRLAEELQFTEALARQTAGNSRQIILSFVNRIRLDFASTWEYHVRALGLTNYLIGATDDDALKALHAAKTPCFSMKTNLPQGEWPWGSPSFKALGPHKIELIYKSIQWGLEVVITDIDALVLRDPFPFMARYPDAGFLTTSDHLGNTTADGGLEDHRGIHSAYNIGYMFFRPSAMPLVLEWRRCTAPALTSLQRPEQPAVCSQSKRWGFSLLALTAALCQRMLSESSASAAI